jgi:hypothetical protein
LCSAYICDSCPDSDAGGSDAVVAVGGTGVGGTGVGGAGVAVGGGGVGVGGMGVAVGGTGVAVGGIGVAVGGTGVAVGSGVEVGSGVAVGVLVTSVSEPGCDASARPVEAGPPDSGSATDCPGGWSIGARGGKTALVAAVAWGSFAAGIDCPLEPAFRLRTSAPDSASTPAATKMTPIR